MSLGELSWFDYLNTNKKDGDIELENVIKIWIKTGNFYGNRKINSLLNTMEE
jgi:hypothetical protein